MKVLRLFFRLIFSQKWSLLGFIIAFLLIVLPANYYNRDLFSSTFQAQEPDKVSIGLVNQDPDSLISQDLVAYLGQYGQIKPLNNQEEESIDALYTQEVDYAISIPQDYGQNLLSSTMNQEVQAPTIIKRTGSITGLNTFINQSLASYLTAFHIHALTVEDEQNSDQVKAMLVRLNDSLEEDLLIEDPIIKTDID